MITVDAIATWAAVGIGVFAALLRLQTHTVASVGLLLGLACVLWGAQALARQQAAVSTPAEALVEAVSAARLARQPQTSAPPTPDAVRFPKKGLRFLRLNADLLAVASKLRFVAAFDKSRYEEWLLAMDRLQKVYVYILGGRYDASSYAETWKDVRDGVLETMYGFVLVVPSSLRHVYGVDPDRACADATRAFRQASDRMAWTLSNFMRFELGLDEAAVALAPGPPVPHNRLVRAGRENLMP
jgi:hypothetical protein